MNFEHATPEILFLLIAGFVIVIWCRRIASGIKVRRLAGVEQIEFGVAQAAESGKPIVFTTGITSIGPTFFACITILKAILKRARRLEVPVLIPQNAPECVAYLTAMLEDEYADANDLNPEVAQIQFLSEEQFAFASGYMGLVHRHQVGTAFLFGQFAGESLILSEAGRQVDAFQVAGSVSPEQVPFFICTCDYTLIGEELFAAGAYVSGDSHMIGNIRAQDILKMCVMAAILIGTIFATVKGMGS